MTQRRILIGSMIGILVFTLLSWVDQKTWMALEMQLLQGQSVLNFFNNEKESNYTIISFDRAEKDNLFEKEANAQKGYLLNLVTELAANEVASVNFLLDRTNFYDIESLDLEMYIGDYQTNIQTLKTKDIEYKWQDDDGNWFFLDRTNRKIPQYNVSELLIETIPEDHLREKNIVFVSPRNQANSDDISLLINYIDDKEVGYQIMPGMVLFILAIAAGLLMASMVYWARIVALFTLSAAALVISQLIFMSINIHIETISSIAAFLMILVLSNLFDLNLMAFKKIDIFKGNDKKNSDGELKELEEVEIGALKEKKARQTSEKLQETETAVDITEKEIQSLRNKFYSEQESNLEELALEFEEKTVKSINAITEKLNELEDSTSLDDRDKVKVALIKHNFNQMIEEMDAILFNLVPFRFEGKEGLINLLELYASKIFLLTRGKMRISIETQFPVVQLEKSQKINTYRIIQRLINLIKSANEESLFNGLNLSISILADKENKIRFKVSYEGMPIKTDESVFQLQDIQKRVDAIEGGEIDFGTKGAEKLERSLTNRIELKIENPKGIMTLGSASYETNSN